MSDDTRARTRESDADASESSCRGYGEMLDRLDDAIDEAHRKIENGRVYDADNEKVRIKWIRALAYTMNVRRQIAKDRDLEEIAERLERLEEQADVDVGVSR